MWDCGIEGECERERVRGGERERGTTTFFVALCVSRSFPGVLHGSTLNLNGLVDSDWFGVEVASFFCRFRSRRSRAVLVCRIMRRFIAVQVMFFSRSTHVQWLSRQNFLLRSTQVLQTNFVARFFQHC